MAKQKIHTNIRSAKEYVNDMNCESTVLLHYSVPFDFNELLLFIKARAILGVERVLAGEYARTFRVGNMRGCFFVRNCPELLALKVKIVSNNICCHSYLCKRIRVMFDLDTNFSLIRPFCEQEPFLSKGMVNGDVPRLPVAFNSFEFVVRAILGQQIAVKAATTLAGRLLSSVGIKTNVGFPKGLDFYFPSPSELIAADFDGIGVAKNRQETIMSVSRAILEGALNLSPTQLFDDFYKNFILIKGIGPWTVNYVAMRGLGMKDVFPSGDLGVIKALSVGSKLLSEKEVIQLAEKWRPYRSYATLCLWNTLAVYN